MDVIGINSCTQKESSELLRLYDARAAIDALDEAIVEAKKRQVEGESTNHRDEWKPDIDPRTAVRARVMPVLEREQVELQKELNELEEQNRKYLARIERNRAEYRAIDQEIKSRLNRAEQVYKIINNMDIEELQQWMLAADEAGTTTAD
ncbi:GDP-mannose transporter, partial [Rhizoctonia solani AG-3 Rhs1AP]